MRELVIYEGGKMSGLSFDEMNNWRFSLSVELKKIANSIDADVKLRVINPVDYYNFEEYRQQTELEVMNYDLARVKESNLLVVNLEGLTTSIGSMIECYEVYKNNIPVLVFGSQIDYDNLHPWIKCCITRHDKNYRECINYIRDFYMR